MSKESHYRSIVKAVIWRILATLTTVTLIYVFTRKWTLSLGIGVLEVIIKLLIYYFHERVWDGVRWGKK